MPNVFKDQATFMRACDQTVGCYDDNQYKLYLKLIREEMEEHSTAFARNDRLEELDALIDILVVTVGALHSLGVDAEGAWHEVMRSNLSKVDRETGMVRKREDGKVLKPITYSPPDLAPFLNKE
jgi:predicted HAD superfamily Cof-like phosphohydrolase